MQPGFPLSEMQSVEQSRIPRSLGSGSCLGLGVEVRSEYRGRQDKFAGDVISEFPINEKADENS